MANANAKTRSPAQERILTISNSGYQPPSKEEGLRSYEFQSWEERRHYVTFPLIRLRGKWLEEAGSHLRQKIRVEVAPGRLVITVK